MEQTYDPAGKVLLRISSSLMIIFGILGILLYGAALGVLIGVTYFTDGIFSGTTDIVGISLLLLGGVLELISGILGVKAVNAPQKAGRCLFWGIATLVISLAGLIHILLRNAAPLYWLSLPLAVITPIAYVIGALKLRRPLSE